MKMNNNIVIVIVIVIIIIIIIVVDEVDEALSSSDDVVLRGAPRAGLSQETQLRELPKVIQRSTDWHTHCLSIRSGGDRILCDKPLPSNSLRLAQLTEESTECPLRTRSISIQR
jgi:hypothetical protein